MRTAVLIPDGVGVRNFVIGRFLHDLTAEGAADVFHVVPDDLLARFHDGLDGQIGRAHV